MEKLLRLNLQFFAEGEGGTSDSSAGNEDGNQPAQEQGSNKGITFTDPTEVPEYEGGIEPLPWEHQPNPNMVESENQNEGQQAPQNNDLQSQLKNEDQQSQEQNNEPTEFDFGGRKVRVNDPDSIKGAFEDFQNGQRTITQQQQQIQQYEQILNNLAQMGIDPNNAQQNQQNQQNQQFQQQNQQQPQTLQPNQLPSEERMQQLHDEYMNKMYDNKFEADLWWEQQPEVQALRQQQTEQFVKPHIEPIQQERQTTQRINEMKSKYQDFDNYVDKMQQILDERPELNNLENIENVYWIAKAQALESQPTLEQQLENPEFRQRLANDDRFRNEVLKNYQSQKQYQQRQAPPMMGRNPGGQSPTYQYRAPRDIKEAGKLVRQNIKFR